ncbi:MAG: cation:proton antiporter, partial [Deltaproteobacteria bacterium]|nr:cation:proton antiporter [Deltaproteobacteria bacterium]
VMLVALGLDSVHPELTAGFVVRFFGWEILGALLIGGMVGLAVSWITARVDDHLIEITLTTLAAFGSFLLASEAHASGVIACLVAGMLTGNFGAKYGMTATTRVAVVSFWEYLTFLANSLVFLLVGLESSPARMLDNWLPIVMVWLALLLARALLVTASLPLLQRLEGKLRRGKGLAIIWGGLRGGIAMVLALSLPRSWPHRELVIDVVFGTCLLTILVQGTTMGRLLRAFSLVSGRLDKDALQEFRGRLRSLHAALRFLDRRREAGTVDEVLYEKLQAELMEEKTELDELMEEKTELEARRKEDPVIEGKVREEEHRELSRQILLLRKVAVQKAQVDRLLGEGVARRLVGELDERLHELDQSLRH